MGLPKPAEKNLEISDDDLQKTLDMEKLTESIERSIAQESTEVNKFYKYFESFQVWLKENAENSEKFRDLTIEKLNFLRQHVTKTIDLVENIKLMTRSEEKLASKKIMTKVDVAQDFTQEGTFAKELDYSKKITELAKEIANRMAQEKEKASSDLNVERKTEDLLDNMLSMLRGISAKLDEYEKHIENSSDLTDLQDIFGNLVTYIQDEKKAFDKLSEFEMVHLHLLSELYLEEESTVSKESDFVNKENIEGELKKPQAKEDKL